jgi:phage/plasmid primase-like uncharacterized protein
MSVDAFRAAMVARGLRRLPDRIEAGKLQRCASSEKQGDTAGWFKLFHDGRGGVFGDWREGWEETWRAARDKPMTAAERNAFRSQAREAARQREAETRMEWVTAQERAATLWNAASAAPEVHAYLTAKAIKPHGLRVHDGELVVPVRCGRELRSLQFIAADGEKRFLAGGRLAGGYYSIGKPDHALCIAEGFATAASIHEATGQAAAVAFNAGNLLPVAKAMRERFPALRLILCADDDAGTEGNPGLSKARAAAEAVAGSLAVPDFGNNRPQGATDFNDLARHAGADAVRACIERAALIEPVSNTASVDGSAECAVLVRGDTIKPAPITWLWPDWIAASKLHVLAGCAVLGITHLSKGSTGRDPVERVTGSLAFGALARVVLIAVREQTEDDTPGRRLLLRAKSNHGPDSGGFAYELAQDSLAGHAGVVASFVRWGDAVEGTARELMAQAEQVDDCAADDAKDFLRKLLLDGPRAAKEIYAEAEGAGYSRDSMKRAKARIGAVAKKQSMSGGWAWRLPDDEGNTKGSEGRCLSSVLRSHPSAKGTLRSEPDGVDL